MIIGRYRQRLTKHTFNKTMGEHDSHMETITLWAKTTKLRGSDQPGEWGGRDQVMAIHYVRSEHVCKAARWLKESTQQRSQSIGLMTRLRGYSGNAKYKPSYHLSVRERKDISSSKENSNKSLYN